MDRLSVVIANHNYDDFLAHAIDSALALEWPNVEIVVVDDGSTDDSRAVINSYGRQVQAIFCENRGQREAANTGFAASTGDVIIFLDSDDILPAALPAKVDEVLVAGVSKVQFQMQRIDSTGRPMGRPTPSFDPLPSSSDICGWATRTTAYPTPPGSGNVYPRWFLERIFPLPPYIGTSADSGCLAAAPLMGDVVSVPGILVGYRRHGSNDSDLLKDSGRFRREVERARARWCFAYNVSGRAGQGVDERPLRASRELLQFRVASDKLTGVSGLDGDTRFRLFLDILRSPSQPGPDRLGHRLLVAAWSALTLLSSRGVARRLIRLRYGHAT